MLLCPVLEQVEARVTHPIHLCMYAYQLCALQASAYNRWRSADVVCHELGHQWFGDYVTCSDWSNVAGGQLSWICKPWHLLHLTDHGRWSAKLVR